MNHDNNKEIIEETPAVIEEDITPRDLMRFAKGILSILAVLFILGSISEMIRPGNDIFESCKTILPPIATLVIGYYFGKA